MATEIVRRPRRRPSTGWQLRRSSEWLRAEVRRLRAQALACYQRTGNRRWLRLYRGLRRSKVA